MDHKQAFYRERCGQGRVLLLTVCFSAARRPALSPFYLSHYAGVSANCAAQEIVPSSWVQAGAWTKQAIKGSPPWCHKPPCVPLRPGPTPALSLCWVWGTLKSLPHPAGARVVLIPRAYAHRQHERLALPGLGRLLLCGCGTSVPRLSVLFSGWPHVGLGRVPLGLLGALLAVALAILRPFFLLLLLLAYLLTNLQDNAGELIEVAKVLNIGQLDAMHEVDLHCLLPSRDVGVTLGNEWAPVSRVRPAETHFAQFPA